jgi:hypothetical protein
MFDAIDLQIVKMMVIGLCISASFMVLVFLVILLFPFPIKRNNNDPNH